MASSIIEQIKQVQDQLRKQAQRLGQLNLKNNDYLEDNEKLALQIVQLRNKINKKKHIIQQENKDKMIIHEKLIKAEREKQLLEIQYQRKKNQQILKQKQLQDSQDKQLLKISSQFKPVKIQEANQIQKVEASQNQHQNKLSEQAVQSQKHEVLVAANSSSSVQVKEQAPSNNNEHYAEQTDRGEYQPPILFMETQNTSNKSDSNQDSDDDQMDEEMLAKLKAAAQAQEEDEENENENEG